MTVGGKPPVWPLYWPSISSSGPPTVPASTRKTLVFSMKPPRSELVFSRCPAWRLALFMVRSRA